MAVCFPVLHHIPMGFRFRRTFKIAPGFYINLSKSGPSLSVGPRGDRATVASQHEDLLHQAKISISGTLRYPVVSWRAIPCGHHI